ncbi:MAG: hypothetical protein SCH98_17240 [Deferrisomatales bacterium]|nr:hypothetical protein [Deferrisomatales bacterium]
MERSRSAPRQQGLERFERNLFERLRALKGGAPPPDPRGGVDRVELALKRIGWGNYRLCAECWGAIGEERLEEDPTRITCSRCASKKPRSREPGGGSRLVQTR